jgi:phosphoribosyl 1,2-cyclic phosphodiesterase
MIATIWGCRGSLATPGAATLEYGGNTSCVQLELDDRTTVVLDAGTGIRELGLRLANRPPASIHLLLTHLHLDHLAGLPFFAPL